SPSNTYRCGDGHYVVIAGNGDAIFKRLMHAIGRDDLGADPALARNDGRVRHNDRLDAAISDWTGLHPLDEVLKVLEAADVPSG
ncbi:CoA transferase, partial [Escherichia coli]|nr:CoA transferase [Escherichia coli]